MGYAIGLLVVFGALYWGFRSLPQAEQDALKAKLKGKLGGQ